MHKIRRTLERLDTLVYRFESIVLGLSLVMMAVLVFSGVIVRTFTRPVGKTASILIGLSGTTDEATANLIANYIGPAVFMTLMGLLCIYALHAARTMAAERAGEAAPRFRASIIKGLAIHLSVLLGIRVLIFAFPTGIAGAQQFALGFMVWSGMLGASIAVRTKRHIMLDAVKGSLDEDSVPLFALLSGVATLFFCAIMAYLSFYKLSEQVGDWWQNPAIGVFQSAPIPKWTITLALPITFTMLGLRFFFSGLGTYLYGPPLKSDDLHGIDIPTDVEDYAEATSDALYGAAHPTEGRL